MKLQEERRRYDELTASGKATEAQIKRQANAVNKAQAEYNRLSTQLSSVDKELKIQSSSWTQLGAKMKSIGKGMTDVGKKISMSVTAPLLAMGAGAFKAAVDYESAFAGVRKTTDATEAEFAVLSQGIRDMSKELPASATSIAGVAEAAGQLGIKKEDILGFTRTMVDLGESTNMTSEQAATQLARFANITGMSMDKISNLGSIIVDLGNNSATTEGEIVSLGMRIAAAGTQAGLTEAEIMAISAAASSLGVEAEAGGTALSMAFTKITNSVDGGGKKLDAFAKASGMSAKDFAKAWKEEPTVAFTALLKGLNESSEAGVNMTDILDDLGIKGIREIDVIKRMSGAHELVVESIGISNNAWDENTALSNEAAERYKTTESQMKMMVNQIKDIGITIGGILIPMARDAMSAVQPLIDKFADMDEKTQKNIVAFGALAAAAGPVLVVGGMLMSGIGGLVTTVATLSTAIGTAGGAATVFGSALTVITGPIVITVAAVSAMTAAGVLLYKNWDDLVGSSKLLHGAIMVLGGPIGMIVGGIKAYKEATSAAIPEVERFSKEIDGLSEPTRKAMEGFFELSDGLAVSLMGASVVTEEFKTDMIGKYSEMNTQIIEGMNKRHDEEMTTLKSLFMNSSVLTDEHETAIVQRAQKSHDERIEAQRLAESRMSEIIEVAVSENRSLRESEKAELDHIREQMNKNAVKYLSESENEQKVIMERLKQEASAITAHQAAEVVKNSIEQKEKVVAEAEALYNETVAAIIRMRDETGHITTEEANKMIAEAGRAKDETVKHAEDMHQNVVKEAKAQADEHVNHVNWETGEVLKKWEVFKNETKSKFEEIKNDIKQKWEEAGQATITKTAELTVSAKKKFDELKSDTIQKMSQTAKSISDGWENGKKYTISKAAEIVIVAKNKFEEKRAAIDRKMTEVKTTISNRWNEAKSFLTNINLMSVGSDIIQGLVNGIKSKMSAVTNAMSDIATNIKNKINSVMDIHSPSRVMMEIGGHIGEGLAIGISSTQATNEKAIAGVAKVITAATKQNASEVTKIADQQEYAKKRIELEHKTSQSVQSATKTSKNKKGQIVKTGAQKVHNIRADAAAKLRKLEEDEQKKLAKINDKAWTDMQKAEEKVSKERLEAIKLYVKDKQSAEELSLYAESEIWRKSLSVFKEGTKERVEVQTAYKKATDAINKEVESINKDYLSKVENLNKEFLDGEKKLNDEYQKALDDRARSLYTFAGIFDEITSREVLGSALLQNLKDQVSAFEDWQKNITALAAKGIDDGLLAELREMGPKAGAEIAALNTLTDQQLQEYVAVWQVKNKQAREQAASELTEQRQNTEKQINELRIKTAEQLRIYQNEWRTSMIATKGTVKNEMAEMPNIGVYAVSGLISGMLSKKSELENAAQSLADIVTSTFQSALDIHSPSRVFKDFGININEGLIEGIKQSYAKVQRTMLSVYGNMARMDGLSAALSGPSGSSVSSSTSTHTENHYHMTFHSPKALDPYESARLGKNAMKELSLQL
ncbi:phage tail tape measure protein [Sporosarcina sp. FSL W7-1283]|uniref:phage tail tape measure protein n=1 Tax=Sporosarcina sp. FSL W7-1283 TaxID=2921560 RepID=UPI0030FAC036